MKKLILVCLLFVCYSALPQQISRSVIASGGEYSANGNITISSTVGEPMINILASSSNILTQGFQQSFSAPVPGCTR